jgi:plasmid maintenance system antidote protein VapI
MNSRGDTNMKFAEYLRERIQAQEARGKSKEEIAKELGFQNPSYIGMLVAGKAKLPLDKVLPMSRALDANPRFMFRLAIRQYWQADGRRCGTR